MIGTMSRIRVYFDADEELRLAIKSAALKEGVSASAFIEETMRAKVGDKAIAEARKVLQQRQAKKDEAE